MSDSDVYWLVTCTSATGGFAQVLPARDACAAKSKVVHQFIESSDGVEVETVERYRGIVIRTKGK